MTDRRNTHDTTESYDQLIELTMAVRDLAREVARVMEEQKGANMQMHGDHKDPGILTRLNLSEDRLDRLQRLVYGAAAAVAIEGFVGIIALGIWIVQKVIVS